MNGFQYLNEQLQFFPHSEGYVKPVVNNLNQITSYLYVYQYKDHLGNVRLSYADCDGDGSINPATEILEENNYYPFGLKHQGYNEIANSCRNEEAEQYTFLDKEFEDNFGLNVTETDFRHYDSALGRFNVMDPMAELAYDFTPYRYGFNNPVFFGDASGLFESYGAAQGWIDTYGLSNANIFYNKDKGHYEIENGGVSFYQKGNDIFYAQFYSMESGYELNIVKGGAGGGGSSLSNSEPSALSALSGALAMGELARQGKAYQFYGKTAQQIEDALSNGKYVHTNGKTYSQKFRGNKYISSKSVKNSLGTAKYLKSTGKLLTVGSVGIAAYQFYESDKSGADYARLTGAGIITATAFIPVVGPFLSIGLGVADSFGVFDPLYNSFD